MKKYLLIIVVIFLSFAYGILIGKYKVFPHDQVKRFQDRFEDNSAVEKEDAEKKIYYSQINLDELLSVTEDNLDSLRSKLNEIIFGTKLLTKQLPDTVYNIDDSSYSNLANLDKIEQFNIIQKYGINSIGYIFNPKEKNNRLLIYHQGHRGDFILGKKTIAFFLEKGFTVYAFNMPLKGKNNQPRIYLDKLGEFPLNIHEKFKYLESPLQYFIAPVISMLNYSENKNFSDITMVGISGGGWTTNLTSAIDTRVNYSFPVAGTHPMFIRLQKPKDTDFEQNLNELSSEINYLDMYIMGAVGKGRFQTQILNKYDSCCFYGDDYLFYEDFIASKVQQFEYGNFKVFSDTSHYEHKISKVALLEILKEINSNPNKK